MDGLFYILLPIISTIISKIAILIILLIAICFVYTRVFLVNSKSHQRIPTRKELPGLVRTLMLLLFGPKHSSKSKSQDSQQGPLACLVVDNFELQADERLEFEGICGMSQAKEDSNDQNKYIAAMFMLPHVIGQSSLITLMVHPSQPLNLLGTLHLRSYIEILNKKLLLQWMHCTSTETSFPLPSQKENESIRFSIETKFWGIIPAAKRGTELVLTLELIANEKNNQKKAELIWKEIMVIYSAKAFPKNKAPDAEALNILSQYSPSSPEKEREETDRLLTDKKQSLSFVNLESFNEIGRINASGTDTWRFSQLSGDFNPIHTSDILAKLFGQKRRIAHGAMVISKALSFLARKNKDVGNSIGFSFKGPTPCDSEVIINLEDVNIANSVSQGSSFDLQCKENSRPSICVRCYQI